MSAEDTADIAVPVGKAETAEGPGASGAKIGFLHGSFRAEALFLLGLGVFFAFIGLLYWFWGYHWPTGPEESGTTMLAGTFLLGLLPGSYYMWWSHRMRPRPEDRNDATIEEGAGVVDAFPDSSIWPFVLGIGAFLLVLSLVFGFWFTALGVPLILTALVGVTAESRRGGAV